MAKMNISIDGKAEELSAATVNLIRTAQERIQYLEQMLLEWIDAYESLRPDSNWLDEHNELVKEARRIRTRKKNVS